MVCQVTIKPGRNAWLLARTDRDAPTQLDVIQTAAAYMSRVIGQRSPEEIVSTGPSRFIIGAARPVLIEGVQTPVDGSGLDSRPSIEGERLQRHLDCVEPYTITADRVWWVTVRFDWRGPTVKRDWPARGVNWLGIPHRGPGGLDWLLVQANWVGPAQETDTTWGGEVGEQVGEGLRKAGAAVSSAIAPAGALLVGAGLLLAVVLVSRRE